MPAAARPVIRRLLLALVLAVAALAQPVVDSLSPGGTYRLLVVSEEIKMSHWINQPTVQRGDGSRVFTLEFPWSADEHRWLSDDRLELKLRRYPGDQPPVTMRVDLAGQRFQVDGGVWKPWSELP